MTIPTRFSALLVCATLLAGCAGPEPVPSADTARIAFAPHSVQVALLDHNVVLNGHSTGAAAVSAAQLKSMLGQWLTQDVSAGLNVYLTDRDPAYEVDLEIEDFETSRSGALYATVALTVQRHGGDIILRRTMRAGRGQGGSDSVLTKQLAQMVLANLRGAGLIA